MNLDLFDNFYRDKRVLITGHTGFKGSWLALWLHELGAKVYGIALDPYSDQDNYVLTGLGSRIEADIRADICDGVRLKEIVSDIKPDIVFHLAAQPLVRLSYEKPVETYMTNLMGTINVLEAIRAVKSVRVGVMITTDKCYENREQVWGYKEDDPMGGYDPYSSSKGAAEIAISSWRRSFFNPDKYDEHGTAIASVRAGNVIGGGDWARDRIVPDCIRAIQAAKPICIRSPHAVRPWQHVLEPLSGYLLLAKLMWENPTKYCEGWNFGPNPDSIATVWQLASALVEAAGEGSLVDASDPNASHEANLLLLDTNKARIRLHWHPALDLKGNVSLTVHWYKNYATSDCYSLCRDEIASYVHQRVSNLNK